MVITGQALKVEKLIAKEGGIIKFDKVLLTANDDGTNVKIGAPYLDDVTVQAKVSKQGKYRTIKVEKFKRKIRYHKVFGQRQRYTEVKIG